MVIARDVCPQDTPIFLTEWTVRLFTCCSPHRFLCSHLRGWVSSYNLISRTRTRPTVLPPPPCPHSVTQVHPHSASLRMHRGRDWSPPRTSVDHLRSSPESGMLRGGSEGDAITNTTLLPHVIPDAREDVEVYVAPIRSSEWREYEKRRKEWMSTVTTGAVTSSGSHAIAPSPSPSSPLRLAEEDARRQAHEQLVPATFEVHPLRSSSSPTWHNSSGGALPVALTVPSTLRDDRFFDNAATSDEEAEEIQQMAHQLRVLRARIAALKGVEPPQAAFDDEAQRLHEALLQHQHALELGERQRRELVDTIHRSLSRSRPPVAAASPEHGASPQSSAPAGVVDRALRFDPASPVRAGLPSRPPEDSARLQDTNCVPEAASTISWSLVQHMGRSRIALPLVPVQRMADIGLPTESCFVFPLMVDVKQQQPTDISSEPLAVMLSSVSSGAELVVAPASAAEDNGSDHHRASWRCFVQGPVHYCEWERQGGIGQGDTVTIPDSVWLTVELFREPDGTTPTASSAHQLAVSVDECRRSWRSQSAVLLPNCEENGSRWLSVEVVAAGYRQWHQPSGVAGFLKSSTATESSASPTTGRAEARRQRLTALLA